MSGDERDEILGYLKAGVSLLKWLGSGSFLSLIALIGVVITDHYDLKHIKKDVEWIKPKVEQIWYKHSPFTVKNEIH